MPHVSHYQLAQIAGTEHLWDAEVRAFMDTITLVPSDRTALGVFADWCDEHGEPELATAARYLSKRKDVHLSRMGGTKRWSLYDLPQGINAVGYPELACYATPLGALATLYYRLTEARKELE